MWRADECDDRCDWPGASARSKFSEQYILGLTFIWELRMMGKVAAYYSDSPEDRYVYHDHDDCWEGKKILPEHKHDGTDNRPRCEVCRDLD